MKSLIMNKNMGDVAMVLWMIACDGLFIDGTRP